MIATIYSAMDRNGMLPESWTCRQCRKQLNANGARPAELYAGTFTGICYECESAPYFIEKTYALDGAMSMSYPPSRPSWRRDRERYTAYADCATCNGTGVEKTEWNGGPLRHACQVCMTRYSQHPLRAKADQRRERLYRAAEAVWQSELLRIARTTLPKRVKKKTLSAAIALLARDARMNAIRQELLARHARAIERLDAFNERNGLYRLAAPAQHQLAA